MGQIDITVASIAVYLLISGLLMSWLGRGISVSQQHQFAFVSIILLILGILPQLALDTIAPGVILSLGMMLFVLHLSAYYSGTPKISVRNYIIILFMSALILAQLIHPVFQTFALGRFVMMAGLWLLLLKLERTISARPYTYSRVESSFLWVWFISSTISLFEPQIQRLPDLFFLILLLTHMEKRWPRQNIPAPIIALYGILFMWHAHFIGSLFLHEASSSSLQPTFIIVLISGLLFQLLRSPSLTKKVLYLFIVQEALIVGLRIDNLFLPEPDLAILLRFLLFIALNGLLVMIESNDEHGLDRQLFKGLFRERPTITTAVLVVALLLAVYPLVYLSANLSVSNIMLGAVVLIGLGLAITLARLSLQEGNRNYRILRPSVSIWSTVVFTILWAAVTFLEILSKNFFG